MPKLKNNKEEEAELRKNPINIFRCAACKDSEAMEFEAFKKHLQAAHQINPDDKEQMSGSRKMIMHMDGSFWFSSNYEWVLHGGLKFFQFCKNARASNDLMRFGD